MSSTRPASPCDAVIVRAPLASTTLPSGPLQLPIEDQTEFVRQFNQIYASIGLRLEPLPGHKLRVGLQREQL